MEFIPANESRFFITLFRWYAFLLFKRRFHRVWINQNYKPGKRSKTVYYLNHHSWWDGLIPLLLNEFRFRQNARALMEDRQMRQYPFFNRIGAFSVDRHHPRKAITSMRYAIQSMQRDNASLFIYPEGEITPAGSAISFEGGLAWLHSKLDHDNIDFVPVAIYIHTMRHDKPELVIHVGEAAAPDPELPHSHITTFFEKHLQQLIDEITGLVRRGDGKFERLV